MPAGQRTMPMCQCESTLKSNLLKAQRMVTDGLPQASVDGLEVSVYGYAKGRLHRHSKQDHLREGWGV